jgi:hypothetical protein
MMIHMSPIFIEKILINLQGPCHDIFELQFFFSSTNTTWAPDPRVNALLEKIWLSQAMVFTGSDSVSYCRRKICSPFVISDVEMSIVIFDRFLRYSRNPPLSPIGTHDIDTVCD